MVTKVINIKGTSDLSCACGSWLKHWQRGSGLILPSMCVEVTCTKRDLVGAHVQREGDSRWYIIPVCSAHNASEFQFNVNTIFVSANVGQTCA